MKMELELERERKPKHGTYVWVLRLIGAMGVGYFVGRF